MSYSTNGTANSAKVSPSSLSSKPKSIERSVASRPGLYSKASPGVARDDSIEKSRKPSGTSRSPTGSSPLAKIDPGTVSLASHLRYRKTYIDSGVPVREASVKISKDTSGNTSCNIHNASRSLRPRSSPNSPEGRIGSVVSRVSPRWTPVPTNTIVHGIHKPPYPQPS